MLHDQRRHKRFTVFIVVEIKSLNAPAKYRLGIIRNFSFEGFSFESQTSDLEVGENIEFKFKHPQDSSYALESGHIVWKKRDGEVDYFMGVQFKDIDKAAKSRMLEIASLAGNVPLNSFLPDKVDKDPHVEEAETADRELFVDEPETTGRVVEVEAEHNEPFKLDIEGVVENDKAAYETTARIKEGPKRTISLYLPIAIALVVTLLVMFGKFNNILEDPVPVPTKPAVQEGADIKDTVPVIVEAQTGNATYYIQVGAWKYSDYAEKMLAKIKQYYPQAYITVENDFHKVRIPEIMNKKQGADIAKDIEGKFKIKPILARQ